MATLSDDQLGLSTLTQPTSNQDIRASTPRRKKSQRRSSLLHHDKLFLKHAWTLYYDERPIKGMEVTDYEKSMKVIGTFQTVQGFWQYFNNLVDPSKFPDYSNLRLFKQDIKPLWEDERNISGGKWTIACQKRETLKIWMMIILELIGEQFTHSDELCGVVLSVRSQVDTIHIWNNNADFSTGHLEETTNHIRKLIGLKQNKPLTYKPHREALQVNQIKKHSGKPHAGSKRRSSIEPKENGHKSSFENIESQPGAGLLSSKSNMSMGNLVARENAEKSSRFKKSSSFSTSQFAGGSSHPAQSSEPASTVAQISVPDAAKSQVASRKAKYKSTSFSSSNTVSYAASQTSRGSSLAVATESSREVSQPQLVTQVVENTVKGSDKASKAPLLWNLFMACLTLFIFVVSLVFLFFA